LTNSPSGLVISERRCGGAGRWSELTIIAGRLSIGVRSNDAKLLEDVLSCPLPASTTVYGSRDYRYCVHALADGRYEIFVGDRGIGVVPARPEAVMCLLSHLHWKLAQASVTETFIHAGSVAWKGRAIILPGRSFTGKTSLVVQLLRKGATYLSDEYALLDPAGRVHPFARQLHVRSADGLTRRLLPASAFTKDIGAASLPAGLILFASYSPAARWQPRRLTPGQALLGLLDNTVCVRRTPRQVLSCLARTALSAPAFAAQRGEARRVADRILELTENYAPD
jgi:hypothetical protein